MTQPPDAVEGRAAIDASLSERAWMKTIIEAAEALGYMVFHDEDSRKNRRGFPDLILCKWPKLVCIEVKKEDEKRSKVTLDQQLWVDSLDGCTEVRAFVARPSDWERVQEILR